MSEESLMKDEELDLTIASLQRRTKTLVALLGAAMLTAVGGLAYAAMGISGLRSENQALVERMEKIDAGREEATEGMQKTRRPLGVIHPLGNFVVNLLDPGNVRYVNCRIEVEVEDSALVQQINSREAQFKDAVISLLGSRTYQDLLGVEGKSRLREELLVRFNRLLPEGQVARVYLTEFVVQ